MIHVPEPTSESESPLKVQTVGVLSVKVTGSPELADAEMVTVPPTVCVPVTGVVVIVCDATVIVSVPD